MNRRLFNWGIRSPKAWVWLACLGVIHGTRAQESLTPERLYQTQRLMMENVGYYLDGAVSVDVSKGIVQWKVPEREIEKRIVQITHQVAELQQMRQLSTDVQFSSEVSELIHRVGQLTFRDLRHWRMADGLSESEQWYVMVQSALEEVKMQVSIELKHHVNAALYGSIQDALSKSSLEETSEWLAVDATSPLPALEWEISPATQQALSNDDAARWGENSLQSSALESWMMRIVELLEAQHLRLSALEAQSGIDLETTQLPRIDTDASLAHLRLPEFFDITFPSGSALLGLNAQLQLNEVIEVLGRYPQIRVVCTGHADAEGPRASNHSLSRKRAQAVREYLLQSGIDSERALLNYFGEERIQYAGAQDRRVEIRFFVN